MALLQSTKKVMLIDNSSLDGEVVRHHLDSHYSFEHILDEDTIMEKIHELSPDCILIDYYLIKLNGLEVLTMLKSMKPEKPIAYIMLTGEKSLEIGIKAMEIGAHDFLTKDNISKESLSKAIAVATKSAALEFQVNSLAYYDSLTNTWSHKAFWQQLEMQIARANRHDELFGLIYMDIDQFKAINDTYGHEIGDKLLVQVVERLSKNIHKGDVLSRFGGEEFIVLLNKVRESKNIGEVANRLKHLLTKPFEVEGKTLNITFSIGVSVFPTDGKDPEELIQRSEMAMYEAKKASDPEFVIFNKSRLKKPLEFIL